MDTATIVLGLDIGGTNIRAGLSDEMGRLTHFEISSSTAMLAGKNCISALEEFIRDYVSRNLSDRIPTAISIGFPSTLDKDRRVVLSTPNLPGMDGLPVVEALEGALGISVFINRDVNLLMLSDIYQHHLSMDGVLVGCYFGTGLGNAICINGQLLSGKNGVAGELGHIPVIGNNRVCGCGNTGCIETLVGGKNLTDWIEQHYPGERIDQLFVRHGDNPFVREYIDMMAIAVATEINILNPDIVILGGGVLQMKEFPFELLREQLNIHVRKPYPCNDLNLIISSNHQENGVMGAGIYAQLELEKRRKRA